MNHANVVTPWGKSQCGHSHLPGCTFYSTAGHGGMKVAAPLNRLIPLALRNLDGWYEEDADARIPEFFLFDRIKAHCLAHQAERIDGYSMTAAEYFAKFDRASLIESIATWNTAGVAVWLGLDLEPFVREKATRMWSTPHYDPAKIPEYVERDVDGYRRQVAFILTKREPCPVVVGDLLPINHSDVPELTVKSLQPFSGTDRNGRLWKIPRKLIRWDVFPRSRDSGPQPDRTSELARLTLPTFNAALPSPAAQPTVIHTALHALLAA